MTVESRTTERNIGQLKVVLGTFEVACASLISANHTNDIEILSRIHLIICLCLSLLMDYALANIGKQLSWHSVSNRTITRWLFEADCII